MIDAPPQPVENLAVVARCETRACWSRVRASRRWRLCVRRHGRWVCTIRNRFRRLPLSDRRYAFAVMACESGSWNDGSPFIGRAEWSPSTWRAAGGRGHPMAQTREVEAWFVVKWTRRVGYHSTAGWPSCP